jgi:hypothetical protein
MLEPVEHVCVSRREIIMTGEGAMTIDSVDEVEACDATIQWEEVSL